MTLYSRSDRRAVSAVPGCDQQHQLTIDPLSGVPSLTCPGHEAYYKGGWKPKVLKYITDPKSGQVTHQERVADMEPGWSTTPDTAPLTPDEERTRGLKLEKGENQLRALEALLTLKGGGIDLTSRPEVLFYLQQSGLPQDVLQGKTVCVNSHENAPGAKFCSECGASMAARAAVEAPDEEPSLDLARLHPQTLKKLCRERHLPDTGTKDELISRLAA
jgi:hypothetical protein